MIWLDIFAMVFSLAFYLITVWSIRQYQKQKGSDKHD